MARKTRKGDSRSTFSILTYEDGSLLDLPWPKDLARPNWTIAISGRPSTRELWAGRVIDALGGSKVAYMEDATFPVGMGMRYTTQFSEIENTGILYYRLMNAELSMAIAEQLEVPMEAFSSGASGLKTEGTIARDALMSNPAAFTDGLHHGPDKLGNVDIVVYEALQKFTKDEFYLEHFSGMPIALIKPRIAALEAEQGWLDLGYEGKQ